MRRTMLSGTAVALALLVAACGSGGESENVQNEAAAGEDMNAMAADPNNPFAQSEMQMNERMMAAVGSDVGDSWVRKMIEHHQGAIDMSQIVLQQNPRADVAAVARMTVEKQGKEIEDLRKLVKQGSPNMQSGELYRPAMTQMHQAMMAAKGADISETFMRKMLEHHRGGVTMSDVALQNGLSGPLRQQVQKTRDDQQKEAEMVEAMLGGQSHQQAMAASGAKPAEQARPEPAPAEKAKPAPTAAPKSTPKAAPKAAPSAEPKAPPAKAPAPATCTPEHRAAGHC
jgi:uncharacterized protein (DUF305 family)